MVRCVAIHAAYFPILFHSRLLAVPLLRLNFESAPLFFCRRRPSRNKSSGRRRDKREMSRKMMVKPWVKIMVDDLDLFVKMACSLFCDRDAVSYTDEGDEEQGRLWVFRGQADSQWKILSTLERHVVSGCAR